MSEFTYAETDSPPPATRSSFATALSRARYLPLWLGLFCAIPVAAGLLRLYELASDAEVTSDNARFFAAPLPIVLHILGASTFALVGAFQFPTSFRQRWPQWHRRVGWALVPSGFVTAATGLWLQLSPALPEDSRGLLTFFRLLFAAGMMVCLGLGTVALFRREYVVHGAWMLRAYAIALGAGTQSLIIVPWFLLFGMPGSRTSAIVMGASWLFNLTLAEQVLRRKGQRRLRAGREDRAGLAASVGAP